MTRPLKVVSINDQAIDNIRYIRETMERAGSFTAVPGWGGMITGISALIAAYIAWRMPSRQLWFLAWMAEAALGLTISAWSMVRKANALKRILSGPGRRFALSLCPAMIAVAVVTIALYRSGMFGLMPGTWLLLYGVAVVAGGAYSVEVVPLMGICLWPWARSPSCLLFNGLISGWPPVSEVFRSFSARSSQRGMVAKHSKAEAHAPKPHSSVRVKAAQSRATTLDRLIHEPVRLGIVSALAVNDGMTFNDLKDLLKTTDGNLSVHARKLEDGGYVLCEKSFEGRTPRTEYTLTTPGRRALEIYLSHMEALIRATREG